MTNKSGRPKVSSIQKAMRHVGKHFFIASQLMNAYLKGDNGVDDSQRRGKRPFGNKTKSLQDSVKQYQAYYTYMVEVAKEDDVSIDVNFEITTQDKDKAWKYLSEHIRSDLESQDVETLKNKVFSADKKSYMSDFPYVEWHEFWIQAELNCYARTCRLITSSLKDNSVNVLSMTEVLRTEESLRGQATYKNQNGKKSKTKAQTLHAKIVRYQNRANKLREKSSMTDEEWENSTFYGEKRSVTRKNDHPKFALVKLEEKINVMEISLEHLLSRSSQVSNVKFERALIQKNRRSLLLKVNMTNEDEKELISVTRQVAVLDQKIKTLELETELVTSTQEDFINHRLSIARKDLNLLLKNEARNDVDESTIFALTALIKDMEMELTSKKEDLDMAI
jgi:hypothetical protein